MQLGPQARTSKADIQRGWGEGKARGISIFLRNYWCWHKGQSPHSQVPGDSIEEIRCQILLESLHLREDHLLCLQWTRTMQYLTDSAGISSWMHSDPCRAESWWAVKCAATRKSSSSNTSVISHPLRDPQTTSWRFTRYIRRSEDKIHLVDEQPPTQHREAGQHLYAMRLQPARWRLVRPERSLRKKLENHPLIKKTEHPPFTHDNFEQRVLRKKFPVVSTVDVRKEVVNYPHHQ